jgi:hypothetical protein
VPRAITWLGSAMVTVGGLLLEAWGLFPGVPWPVVALLGFIVFSAVSYVTIAGLEARLNTQPFIRLDASDNEWNNRALELEEPDPTTRMVAAHGEFYKLVTVYASAYVKRCVVKVNNLSQDGQTCRGFVPGTLRWFGRDGQGAESKNFFGRDFALLLSRRPDRQKWQLQAPVRDGRGARFWYDPGEYEVELMVSAENAFRAHRIAGVLKIGPRFDDVNFVRTR